jgi:hypothetical protein
MLTTDQLKKLNTKRLLEYKKKLNKDLWLFTSYVWGNADHDMYLACPNEQEKFCLIKRIINIIKNILNNREHIVRKGK